MKNILIIISLFISLISFCGCGIRYEQRMVVFSNLNYSKEFTINLNTTESRYDEFVVKVEKNKERSNYSFAINILDTENNSSKTIFVVMDNTTKPDGYLWINGEKIILIESRF